MRSAISTLFIVFFCLSVDQAASYSTVRKQISLSQKCWVTSSGSQNFQRNLLPENAGDPAQPDEIRVLAFRVQFQEDDDNMTTGTGRFLMDSPTDTTIDAPPHDFDYFQNQLQALSNYYRTVSGGRLIIKSAVFPDLLNVDQKMGYYNPGTTDERTNQGLAELFRDAVEAADARNAPFSDYDAFIVFHAGVGRDIELGYDPTSKDIPSVFLNSHDLDEQLEDKYSYGIPVQNGKYIVDEGVLLPEWQNQEGFQFGMLGTMTLMFGFQLGLPALWDTQYGHSGVGRWGMMDQGSGNFNGMIPCEPCAFSKVYMGWVTPIDISQGENLVIACSKATDPRKIYRVPVNDHEYYLIENRQYDVNGDSVTYGTDPDGRRVQFPYTGFLELDEPVGVIISVDEYDYGLPGSGILIWHIDEQVIAEKLSVNNINSDKKHRAVDLEEADGAQDIGEVYGFLSGGGGSESGVMHDAWFGDNEIHRMANQSDTVMFGPDTYPDTYSNSGANTHLVFSDFSKSDTLMTFSVSPDWTQTGFPVRFKQNINHFSPLCGDLDGDGDYEIVIVNHEGQIFAWHHDGQPVVKSTETDQYISQTGEVITYDLPLMWNEKKPVFNAPPVLGDFDKDGRDELIVYFQNHGIYSFQIDPDGRVNRNLVLYSDESKEEYVRLMLLDEENGVLIVAVNLFILKAIDAQGKIVWQYPQWESWIDAIYKRPFGNGWALQQNGPGEVVLLNSTGNIDAEIPVPTTKSWRFAIAGNGAGDERFWIMSAEGVFGYDPASGDWLKSVSTGSLKNVTNPAIADLNKDGYVEICIAGNGQLMCFQENGTPYEGFPVPTLQGERKLSQPLVADILNDDALEIMLPNSIGDIEIWESNGGFVPLDKISLGVSVEHPVLEDLDNDKDLEIIAAGNGILQVFDLKSTGDVAWGYAMHDAAGTGLYTATKTPRAPQKNWFPEKLAYNYPNPTEGNSTTIRYRLEQDATVTLKIFDLAGEKIDEFKGPGLAMADNEVLWDLSDVDSGVYFCQIEADGEDGVKNVVIKIGVVK